MGTSGLDPIDGKIISMLVEDARLSTRAIARAVGMSPTGVSERLQRLHSRGIILGYHADIDPAAFGWDVEAIIGIVTQQGGDSLRTLVDHLMTFQEVISAHIIAGRWDILLGVRSRSHQALQSFVVETLPAAPGFVRSETMVCWEVRRRSAGSFLTDHDVNGSTTLGWPSDDGGDRPTP